jgi:hypothetical protein
MKSYFARGFLDLRFGWCWGERAVIGIDLWKAATTSKYEAELEQEGAMLILTAMALATANKSVGAKDPIALVAKGQLECHQPDDKKRTCRSIASYQRRPDGSYNNTAIILVSNSGPTTFEASTPVTVRAGAVCGMVRAEDISKGKLRVANRLLSDSEAAPILAQVAKAMKPMFDKEICTSYVRSPNGLTAKATIDGVYRSDADQPVKWVKPKEGYTVSP